MLTVRLRDGTPVDLRPIEPSDAPAMRAAFERMSPESRYRRFLAAHPRLTEGEVRYLTEIDHTNHEAIVAIDPASGEGLGVARYVREDDPESAEVAVAVVDDWQGRGVGWELLHALVARAREEGVRRFTASVLTGNHTMVALLEELGEVHLDRRDDNVCSYTVELTGRGVGALSTLLKAAARFGV